MISTIVTVCGALSPVSLRAQPAAAAPAKPTGADPDALPASYRAAIDLAFAEFSSGNYAEARTRFLEARAIMPNARVLRALGMVEYELRNYAQALEYIEQALQSRVRPLPAAERTETEQLGQRARDYLARYTLKVSPPDARIMLDGAPVLAVADRPILIEIGDHVLEVEAKGHAPIRRELRVESSDDQTIVVDLKQLTDLKQIEQRKAAAPRAALVPSAASTSKPSTPLYANPWLWIGTLGVVVGASVVVASIAGSGAPFEVRSPTSTPQTPPGAVIQLLSAP